MLRYTNNDDEEFYKNKCKQLQAENKKLIEKKDKYYQNNLTYERQISELIQTLEEIRKIVLLEIDRTDADDELMQIYGSISNKINEVLNEN